MKEFKYKINGNEYTSTVEETENNTLKVTVNGKVFSVELPSEAAAFRPVIKPVVAPVAPNAPAPRVIQAAGPADVVSPLPGTITDIKVTVGQKVKRGDVLVIMEAMKMANDIVAENDGVIKSIEVKKGDNVNQGDVLVSMEADEVVATPKQAKPADATPKPAPTPGAATVTAPLPGTISKINVTVDQRVKAGDVLLIMEAMKMANNIVSDGDGIVKAINVKEGDQVQSGDVLVEMA